MSSAMAPKYGTAVGNCIVVTVTPRRANAAYELALGSTRRVDGAFVGVRIAEQQHSESDEALHDEPESAAAHGP